MIIAAIALVTAVLQPLPPAASATPPEPTFTTFVIEHHVNALLIWQQAERENAVRIWDAEIERQHQARHEAERIAALHEAEHQAEREASVRRSQARPAPRAATRAASPQRAAQGSGACGGNLPSCSIMNCESGGNLNAQNSQSSASGKWQFLDSTWNGYGGYARASDAPESVQDAAARALWNGGRGRSQWSC